MNLFDKFMEFATTRGETPASFGAFHLISLAVFAVATVLLVKWLIKVPEGTYKIALTVIWVIFVIGEVYRELAFAFSTDGTIATYTYKWYLFPFQICSAPLYLLPPIILLKRGRIKDALMGYMATFSLFGGIAVMIYPGDVFCSIIGINYQSLIHHGLQVVVGIIFMVKMRFMYHLRIYFSSALVFAAMLAIAMTLNLSVHNAFVGAGISDTFNMFYISPYHGCHIPILSSIREAASYPVFFLSYCFGFSLVAAIVFYLQRFIISAVAKRWPLSDYPNEN